MSRIVITVDQVRDKMALLMHLRAVTGRSWADIQNRLRTREPVIECILFNNDHEDRARELEGVLDLKPPDAATFKVFELCPDEAFDSQHAGQREISATVLKNILMEHARQRAELDNQ